MAAGSKTSDTYHWLSHTCPFYCYRSVCFKGIWVVHNSYCTAEIRHVCSGTCSPFCQSKSHNYSKAVSEENLSYFGTKVCPRLYLTFNNILDFSFGYHVSDIRKAFMICYDARLNPRLTNVFL